LLSRLDHYGRCFGMVFQITDDLLDVEGTTEDTGKRVNKDAARGKLTYPGLLGIPESRRRARQLGHEGQECLAPLGSRGERLGELLRFVIERDR
jgi:geranylgeranyl diphosphate synthase type II